MNIVEEPWNDVLEAGPDPSIYETVPGEPYGDFWAMAQGACDYLEKVICIDGDARWGKLMTICTPEAAIYITREQAKAFFGFTN